MSATAHKTEAIDMLSAALTYARRGWRVFPLHTPIISDGAAKCSCRKTICANIGKHPRTRNGLKDATTNEATIRKWFQQWPLANIGITTGADSFVALDVDPKHGGDETLTKLLAQHGDFDETVTARTGSGGRHICFAHPGVKIKNVQASKKIGAGLDVRGDGGYIVAAPSLHASGQRYEWLNCHAKLAAMPAWLLETLTSEATRKTSSNHLRAIIPEHERNNTLTSIAGRMRRYGASREQIEADLLETNATRCIPPLDSDEVLKIAASVSRYEPESTPSAQPFNLTDLGNARRLVALHGGDLRYNHLWQKWLVWNGQRWIVDDTAEVMRRAKDTVRAMYAEAGSAPDDETRKKLGSWAIRSESEARINATISLAASEPGIPILPDEMDTDPYLLNFQNGTLDLRTGKLREHRREDNITKLCPINYDASAECPIWLAFLHRIMAGNEKLISFLQRAVGYSLTGDVRERVLFILHGIGANGKTVFVETLYAALGDYAMRTPTSTLMQKRDGSVPNDVARLKGMRFVHASESEEGRRLAEAEIKDLTGGDTISARFMRAEWFDFKPEFKLWLRTNHKPIVRGTDEGIWDRLKLIPFAVRIPEAEQDRSLSMKLRAELPGIIAWAVRGCLEWQRNGLGVPDEVQSATAKYRSEQDSFANFVTECCALVPDAWISSKDLRDHYEQWSDDRGDYKLLSGNAFTERLKALGCEPRTVRNVRGWQGIGLVQNFG